MLRRLLSAAGWLLPAAALAYLGVALFEQGVHDVVARLDLGVLAIAAAVAFLYGAALYLLALSWSLSLRALERPGVSLATAVRIYAFSTFAKYLPGNVFHYAGRQLAAGRQGYGQKAVAQATLLEIAGHLGTSLALLLLLLPFIDGPLPGAGELFGEHLTIEPASLFLAGALLTALLLLVQWRHRVFPVLPRHMLAAVAGLQTAFFVLATLLGICLAAAVLGAGPEDLPGIAFACLLAWLVGFVVPGAPGGMGVREACLLLALAPYGETPAILAFAAVSRAALLLGEALFALCGFLLGPRPVAGRPAV